MVNTDTSDEQSRNFLNLWELSVTLIKPLQFLLDKFSDKTFSVTVCEIHLWVKTLSKLECACS